MPLTKAGAFLGSGLMRGLNTMQEPLAASSGLPCFLGAPLEAQMVQTLPAEQETWVQSLGQEYPLEKETATHSGILAWEAPWTEEPGGL